MCTLPKTTQLTYAYKKPFILENSNQLLIPEKNAVNLQTYCYINYALKEAFCFR